MTQEAELDRLLVEQYIPGAEIALEGLLDRGELRILTLFDKPDPMEGPYFEETIYVTPSRLSPGMQTRIFDCAAGTASALGLSEGPLHAEFRVNDGGPWVLEIAPRPIGGLCSRALRFGPERIFLEELLVRHAMGLPGADLPRESLAAGVMMIPVPAAACWRASRAWSEPPPRPASMKCRSPRGCTTSSPRGRRGRAIWVLSSLAPTRRGGRSRAAPRARGIAVHDCAATAGGAPGGRRHGS